MTNPVMLTHRLFLSDDRLDCHWHLTWCPGCDLLHAFRTEVEGGINAQPLWTWDGNDKNPTFEPSMKVTLDESRICHSFLRNGIWDFLEDSTAHSLRGHQPMIPLPDWVVGLHD